MFERLLYGLDAEDSLSRGATQILQILQQAILSNQEAVIRGADPMALHDMRVAIRRSRVALTIFRDSLGRDRVKPFRKKLRSVGNALGDVRDYDVFLEFTYRYLPSISLNRRGGLTSLIRWVLGWRVLARVEMLEYLQGKYYPAMMRSYEAYLADPFAGIGEMIPDQRSTRVAAPELVDRQLRRALAFPPQLLAVTFVELHQLRISFKRLRYSLEFFREIFGQDAEEAILRLKDIQDHLGHLSDAHVACQIVTRYLENERQPGAGAPLLERWEPDEVVEYLAVQNARRNYLLNTFNTSWEAFRGVESQRIFSTVVAPPAPEYQGTLALLPAA